MQKGSFTLFETLLSLSILAIVISGFSKMVVFDDSSNKNHMLLNSLENRFDTNDLSSFQKSFKTLKITTNKATKYINITQYSYKNENMTLIKYEK